MTLWQMASTSSMSGLDSDNVHHEAYKFKELTQQIIENTPGLANKAKVVYFDGM